MAKINVTKRFDDITSTRANATPFSVFNVSDTLGNSTDLRDICRDHIYPNLLNEKYMKKVTAEDIDALKNSIEEHTLFHNLVVLNDGSSRYRLISGEKRWRAINLMTEEKYNEIFPSGIPCKLIDGDTITDEDDELILLLTCNVIVFSNGLPDRDQLTDLIKVYQRKGIDRKEVITYLSSKLKSSESTIRLIYNEAQAIDSLKDLYNAGRINATALSVLAQAKEEAQQTYVDFIKDNCSEKEIIGQTEAYNIKKNAKRKKNGEAISESKSFITIRTGNESAFKTFKRIQKMKLDSMSKPELELSIRELKETKQLIDECIKNISEQIK